MSRELGLAVLREDYRGARIPVMEHFGALSREAVIGLTGRDPLAEGPAAINDIYRQLARELDVDLNWWGLPGADAAVYDWSDGQATRLNRAGQTCVQWGIFGTEHAEDGRHYHHIPRPPDVEAALAFDPERWFPETVEDLVGKFTREYAAISNSCGDACYPLPFHYTTAFHFPLAIFGFELMCEAAMEDDAAFGRLIERFAQVSWRITTAWSRVSGLAGFICHDDLAMSAGPIFPPEWYRRHIFPHYAEIFRPLRRQAIPVIFTSDGNCSALVDDIFAAGADGLNFEHWVDLAALVERYPDKILIGNLSSDVLAHGTPGQIVEHTTRCLRTGARARRFVVNVGGQLTHDIPLDNLRCYLSTRHRLTCDRHG